MLQPPGSDALTLKPVDAAKNMQFGGTVRPARGDQW